MDKLEKIVDENTSKVMVNDLPRQEEYSQIIYDAQDAGKHYQSDFAKSQEANRKAWSGITNLMAQCIARGMRLGYHKPEGANWDETVMSSGDLCLLVCHEHRLNTLEAKDCDGLDCELCQRNKQAEISFKAGEEKSDKLWCGALQEAGLDISHPSEIMREVSKIKKAGIREVVEKVRQATHASSDPREIEKLIVALLNEYEV